MKRDQESGQTHDVRSLRWYPPTWRARYGDEVSTLLNDEYGRRLPVTVRLGLVTGGIRQRVRYAGLAGDAVPAADRVRAGALLVLAAWTAFVIAGLSFAKFSEHFDQALPHGAGTHRVADVAFTVLQVAAGVASLLVIGGALLAVPTFLRFLRGDGWSAVRRHFRRAVACSGITVAVTVPLLVWAHHLTSHQRNDGFHWYGALVLGWAALIFLTVTLWSVFAMATGRRVEFTQTILTAESVLAAYVAGAMLVMLGATAFWWGAMAKDAPSFLTASPGGIAGSPWDIWLIATVEVMALAVCAGTVGVVRELRTWARMQAA